jgi:hypothetical protein
MILVVVSPIAYLIYILIPKKKKENMLMFFQKHPIDITSKKEENNINIKHKNNPCNLLIQSMKSIERKKIISDNDIKLLQNIQKNLKFYKCSSPNAHI